MSTQKLEYDSSVGGSVVLASHVPTYRYAAAALQEIKTLLNSVRQPETTKLIFQTLPKHMRRRAMSHHPKRLPRKYRAAHKAQMSKAGKPIQTKRPSRKYRRRPKNLLRDYLRRQRRHVWLETHIWHAKRFHMVDRWGYRLPYASCDKTYRACYRATAQHCLLQDISYFACIELSANLELLKSGFARLSSAECGLSIVAKTYLSGRREGSIELFRDGQYPNGALGRVSFMWRPVEISSIDENNSTRTLWLWLHPSSYTTILEQLILVFNLKSLKSIKVPIECESELMETDDKSESEKPKHLRVKQQRRLQFMTKTLAYERVKRYANSDATITLNELKDNMNRFRLTGPLSQSVLTEAFKPYNVDASNDNWLVNWLASQPEFQEYHEKQADYFQRATKLHSPNELLSNMIIGLNIEDPRLQRPQKRSKAKPHHTAEITNINLANELILNASNYLPISAIWQSEYRDRLCEQMVSTHSYCELRAKHAIVPGAMCQFERDLQPVPVLLIQRPGSKHSQYKRLGYGSGWDIIAPPGYGMIIWMTLIMWGAKPGGLREFDSVAREAGNEQQLPDSVAGRQQNALKALELETKYFRLPPNKRCNYRKFAVVSPFRAPFAQLIRDWLPDALTQTTTPTCDDKLYHVIRNRQLLERIDKSVRQRNAPFPSNNELPTNGLIQIQLRLHTRGNLTDNALICLPTSADFKRQLKQMKHEDHAPVYVEPLLGDPNEKQRNTLRFTHKRLLKRLRARRVREKRKLQETATKRVHIRAANTSQLVAKHFKDMCNLWLPKNATETLLSVRKQGTRDVFGYITTASFSFTEATVCAVGYVTVAGLHTLLTLCRSKHQLLKQPPMCLVRDTKSRDYRFATFKVNVDVASPV